MYKFDDLGRLKAFVEVNIMDTAEVTGVLGCSRQYVSQLVSEGKLVPIKQTLNHKLFWKGDVDEILKRRADKAKTSH